MEVQTYCEQHRELLLKYRKTVQAFTKSVARLQEEGLFQVEFMLLLQFAQRARQRCEAARIDLQGHIQQHRCY